MIRDIRMIQKAMEQRWPIKQEYKEALVKRLMRIIADPKSSPREVTAASRALMAAEQQNIGDEQEENAAINTGGNRFLAIARQLKLGVLDGVVVAAGAGGDTKPASDLRGDK